MDFTFNTGLETFAAFAVAYPVIQVNATLRKYVTHPLRDRLAAASNYETASFGILFLIECAFFLWFGYTLLDYLIPVSAGHRDFLLENAGYATGTNTIAVAQLPNQPSSFLHYTKDYFDWFYECFLDKNHKFTTAIKDAKVGGRTSEDVRDILSKDGYSITFQHFVTAGNPFYYHKLAGGIIGCGVCVTLLPEIVKCINEIISTRIAAPNARASTKALFEMSVGEPLHKSKWAKAVFEDYHKPGNGGKSYMQHCAKYEFTHVIRDEIGPEIAGTLKRVLAAIITDIQHKPTMMIDAKDDTVTLTPQNVSLPKSALQGHEMKFENDEEALITTPLPRTAPTGLIKSAALADFFLGDSESTLSDVEAGNLIGQLAYDVKKLDPTFAAAPPQFGEGLDTVYQEFKTRNGLTSCFLRLPPAASKGKSNATATPATTTTAATKGKGNATATPATTTPGDSPGQIVRKDDGGLFSGDEG